ncbi:hypothetical protein EDC96DRAFT_575444 [Choanephora cucurbitarum]|nr:hypothetical protein EDC96DRAFT_575444 [Choanephora cucurbitarum]
MEDLCRHFRTKVFGKPTRLSSTLKVEILDLLSDYHNDGDKKKLKSSLAEIVKREDGAVFRTVEGLMTLFDNVLFPAPHPLTKCRPDFAVEVSADRNFINLIGTFSVALLTQNNLKHVLAFQAKGLEVSFYLCFHHLGSFVMTEIEVINFPSTIDEYCQFWRLCSISAMFMNNIATSNKNNDKKLL